MLILSVLPAWRDGARRAARICTLEIGGDWIVLELVDGRLARFPICWSAPLAAASDYEREQWRRLAGGAAVAWPALGEVLVLNTLPIHREDPDQIREAPFHLRLAHG